jgi:cytochrome d ubiquinol oxidase subunit II
VLIGTPAIATSSYLVAVDLAGDAHRPGKRTLERDFPVRALVTGLVAGPLAIAALAVVRADAPLIWTGLTGGAGLVMVCASASISSMEKAARGRRPDRVA